MTTEYATGTATISNVEFSLVNGSTVLAAKTDAGVYQLVIDVSAMTATEAYSVKYYETTVIGGTKRVAHHVVLSGVASDPIYFGPALALINGWDMTMVKLLGTDRSIPWSIRKA